MPSNRVERYKGFTIEVTYLSHSHDVEVFAMRDEYPALAIYDKSVEDAKARIDRYWEQRRGGRS